MFGDIIQFKNKDLAYFYLENKKTFFFSVINVVISIHSFLSDPSFFVSMEKSESHSGKQSLHEIINQVYEFLKGKGKVHQSILRDVVPSPSNKHILELIKNIQDRPYLHFREKGRYTYLELGSKVRAEESRANQISTFG